MLHEPGVQRLRPPVQSDVALAATRQREPCQARQRLRRNADLVAAVDSVVDQRGPVHHERAQGGRQERQPLIVNEELGDGQSHVEQVAREHRGGPRRDVATNEDVGFATVLEPAQLLVGHAVRREQVLAGEDVVVVNDAGVGEDHGRTPGRG